MSEPLRRRVRHRAGTTPTPAADPSRVVLRRRRCGEAPTRRKAGRAGSGGAWRQVLRQVFLAGLVLLAAGPAWAVAERYHEKIAVFVQQTRAYFDWTSMRAPEVATTRRVPPVAPAADSQGVTGTLASAAAWAWKD